MLLPQLLAICCPNWKSKTHKERTAEPFQDKVGQPFRISYFTEKSVTYAGHVGRIWMPQCCRGTLIVFFCGVPIQAARGFCHFSHFLDVTYLHFLLTWVILFPSQVSHGTEDFIVIVFLVTSFSKEIL